ncbi:uncharacterized protein TNCT_82331 [Trichonephila clavata]|uniref:Uncharacterized protein n=1 Tax=Trichonephila clavata TaxID=2740835 RepID=A0A8X6FSK9_TRICU|nr:uncharacterized protein TNCT_82331 [Trichonephila clavata]
MIFGKPGVPTLKQISFVVTAVRICNDQEVQAFMQRYGHVPFSFPSNELRIFLNKEIPESSQREMYKLCIKGRNYVINPRHRRRFVHRLDKYDDFSFNSFGFTANNLPSTTWEEMIFRKISCIDLPNILGYELMSIIRCICLEIYRWQKMHEDSIGCVFSDIQKFLCWDAQGKINRIKTAKSLINNESIRISERYNLARHYGFERDVLSLWEKMSIAEKDYANQLGDQYGQRAWFEYGATGTAENSIEIYWEAFGNPLNFRKLFSLLTPIQKQEWCQRLILLKLMDYNDVCFCLSFFKENQLENILRRYSVEILQYYLVWPFQKEFLNVTKILWPYMSIQDYIHLLNFIMYQRIMIGWKDFDYVWLVKEFWRQTPNNLKELAKRDMIYQLILPVINYKENKRFPNEMILQNYEGNILEFHHVGIYCKLSRNLVLVDI